MEVVGPQVMSHASMAPRQGQHHFRRRCDLSGIQRPTQSCPIFLWPIIFFAFQMRLCIYIIENPCLLMYLNACFMTPYDIHSNGCLQSSAAGIRCGSAAAAATRRGAAKDLRWDLGPEAQWYQRPTKPQPKGPQGSQRPKEWLCAERIWMAVGLLVACQMQNESGWLGGLMKIVLQGQDKSLAKIGPIQGAAIVYLVGLEVEFPMRGLFWGLLLGWPYPIMSLGLCCGGLDSFLAFKIFLKKVPLESVGLVTAHRPNLCDSVVAPGLCELSQLVRGWRFCYLSKSWCQGGDSSHAGAHRGWLRLGCHIAGLQKFKFERREISNDAGVLIDLTSEQRQTSSGTPFLLPPGLEKRLLGNFLESSWGLLGQLLQTSGCEPFDCSSVPKCHQSELAIGAAPRSRCLVYS